MNKYHAIPFDISASGFFFTTYEDYQRQSANHKNKYGFYVDEFELEYIDGDNGELFSALGINQANLEQWFDDFETLEGDERHKAIYLADYIGCPMAEIHDRLEDVSFYEGTAKEFAETYISDCGLLDDMPKNLQVYFDIDAYARDLLLAGDITEIVIAGTRYIAWGV